MGLKFKSPTKVEDYEDRMESRVEGEEWNAGWVVRKLQLCEGENFVGWSLLSWTWGVTASWPSSPSGWCSQPCPQSAHLTSVPVTTCPTSKEFGTGSSLQVLLDQLFLCRLVSVVANTQCSVKHCFEAFGAFNLRKKSIKNVRFILVMCCVLGQYYYKINFDNEE